MQESCEPISEMLVDYADGELSPSESNEVTEHLAKCDRCCKTLKALERSLEVAGVVWEDGLKEIKAVRIPAVRRGSQFKWRRYAAVAASILILAGISIIRRTPTTPKEAASTFAEIEQKIEESASAARLFAAAELLAEYPDCESIVKQQYRYIVETYPETPAAAQAKSRIQ